MTPRNQHIIMLASVKKAKKYQEEIASRKKTPGDYFFEILQKEYSKKREDKSTINDSDEFRTFIGSLPVEEFYKLLSHTKKPVIMAEFQLRADGSDWSPDEVALLADIVTVADVTIYANGERNVRVPHKDAFTGTIIMVPGLLLTTLEGTNPDREEVVYEGTQDPNFTYSKRKKYNVPVFEDFSEAVELIKFDSFYHVYRRRILPSLAMINQRAKDDGKKLILTLPGIGTECFFKGDFDANYLKSMLTAAIHRMIVENQDVFSEFKAVYLDLYEHDNRIPSIYQQDKQTVPLYILHTKNQNADRQLLAHPATFNPEYKDCRLVNISASNAFSWAGNKGLAGEDETNEATVFLCTSLGAVTIEPGRFSNHRKYKPLDYDNYQDRITTLQKQFAGNASWHIDPLKSLSQSAFNQTDFAETKYHTATKDSRPYTSAQALKIMQLFSRFDPLVKLTKTSALEPIENESSDNHTYLLNPSSRATLKSKEISVARARMKDLDWCKKNYAKDNVTAFVKTLNELIDTQENNDEDSQNVEQFKTDIMNYYNESESSACWVLSLYKNKKDYSFVKKMLDLCKSNPSMAWSYSTLKPALQEDLIKYLKKNQDNLNDTKKVNLDNFLKIKIAAEIQKYNPCCKFSLFGHHHTARAAHVTNAILTAQNRFQVAGILQNQFDLFHQDDYPPRDTDQLSDRFSKKEQLKNAKKGGYFDAIKNAMTEINKFSTDGQRLVTTTRPLRK